jgi:DhnA family fructose-bisphosphate aldolase class Ia
MELGADLIKLPKMDDLSVIKEIKAIAPNLPLAVRGGDPVSKDAFIEYLHNGIKNDINGFIIGRNLWQQEDAVVFGKEIQKIIFSSPK